MTVCNVNGDAAARAATSRTLRAGGVDVVEAGSGAEALQTLMQSSPALVIVDTALPDMDASELCRRIKSDPATKAVLVLQLFAHSGDDHDGRRALASGADSFLTIPAEPAVLLGSVRTLLRLAKAERAVAATATRYRELANELPQLIWTCQPDGACDYLNEQWVRYTGVPAEPQLGSGWLDVVHPADRERTISAWRDSIEHRAPYAIEFRIRGADGRYRWFQTRAVPIHDPDGRIVRWLGSNTDIDERKRAEEALQASEERYRVLVESAHDYAIFLLDADGRVMSWNSGAQHLLGYDEQEIIGQHVSRFFTKEDIASGMPETEMRTARSAGRAAGSGWRVRKDGSLFRAEGFVRPVYNAEREFVGFHKIMHDVTARWQLEAERELLLAKAQEGQRQAEEASRAKDEFLAVLSHELRTPLSPLLTWSRLLRTGRLEGTGIKHALDAIERAVKAQVQLIEDLLDVSRIIAGKLQLNVQAVELSTVIQDVVESMRPAALAKRIRLDVSLDEPPAIVSGDPARLQQVMWNLVSNAIKFTPKEGRVQIQARPVASHVEVVVRDTGQGITPEFLPFVFDRFRQADSTSTRAHGGLGLGLAIVRHLVELHGGRVRAESAGAGHGAVFIVELPIAPFKDSSQPARSYGRGTTFSSASGELAGRRVLVVDDERDTIDALFLLLTQAGAEVRGAPSVAEGLDILKQWEPDLLIADIGMPGEDGYALIRKVRALDPARVGRVPAVALTAYARSEDRVKVLAHGFQQHLAKPVEPDALLTAATSLVGAALPDGPATELPRAEEDAGPLPTQLSRS